MALPFLICLAMYCGYRMFLSANELQPPARVQTHPNLPQGKEQVTLILSKTVRCKLPLNIDNTLIIRHNSICPSPTGEVRWGLMLIFYVIFLSFISIINFVAYPGFCLKIISRIIS